MPRNRKKSITVRNSFLVITVINIHVHEDTSSTYKPHIYLIDKDSLYNNRKIKELCRLSAIGSFIGKDPIISIDFIMIH